ncbi:MAG: hypothetical protein VYB77_03695 [Planctomycetota bacterium]|nr:hypothetical protein [Planctomycetota bacterium]
MLLISFLIALVLTALLWPFFSGALARSRQRTEELLDRADPAQRADLEFTLPPRALRTGRAAAILQFMLVLILFTGVTYFLIGG